MASTTIHGSLLDSSSASAIAARSALAAAPRDPLMFGIQVNGFFQVSQERGDTAGGDSTHPADQWRLDHAAGPTVTAQRVSAPFAAIPSIGRGITLSTSAGSAYGSSSFTILQQFIEGERVRGRLLWGTANAKSIKVVSVIRPTISGRAYVTVRNSASDRSYLAPIDLTGGTDNYVSVTIPGDTSGTWTVGASRLLAVGLCFGTGSTYQGTASAWQAGQYFGASDSTNFFATTSNAVIVGPTLVFVGDGEVPTLAQLPNYQRELDLETRLCQRYWRDLGTLYIAGYSGGSNKYHTEHFSVVPLRTSSPTITQSSVTDTNVSLCSITVKGAANDTIQIALEGSSTGVVDRTASITINNRM